MWLVVSKRSCNRITRPDNPGRIFPKYPAPPKSAKDLKQNSSGQGPDFWPDICQVLFMGPDFPGGPDYPALT